MGLRAPAFRRDLSLADSDAEMAQFCDSVTDNFRVISPKDFRVMT